MRDTQFTQMLRAINDVRDDLKEFKNEMNRRWEENDKKWEANKKELENIIKKVDSRYKETKDIFDAYENSVENMYQDNKKKIIALEKRLKVANV